MYKRVKATEVNESDDECDHRYKVPNVDMLPANEDDLGSSSNDISDDSSDDDSPKKPIGKVAAKIDNSNENASTANIREVISMERREINGVVCYIGTVNANGQTPQTALLGETLPQSSVASVANTSGSTHAGSSSESNEQQQPSTSNNLRSPNEPPPTNPSNQQIIIINARPVNK